MGRSPSSCFRKPHLRDYGPPAALKAQHLTDEQIFMTARKHAYELGKQYGHDDPEEEVRWHEKMVKKVAERRAGQMSYQTVEPMQGVA